MRIARWRDGADTGEGFVIDDRVVPFPDSLTVAEVLAQGLDAAHALFARTAEVGTPLTDVQLLAPVVPGAIRDFVTFEEHVEGVSAGVEGKSEVVPEWYQAPTFYFTNPHTVLGPGEPVRPPVTDRLDFELEVAVVIGGVGGSDGTNLTPDAAASHIFGYTIMNDWSARDLQAREMKVRLGPAKGKDFGTSLGPWIVTADELAPFLDADGFLAVRAEVFVNGALTGQDLVSNMGWRFPELIAYAARNAKVVPGDVLGSGTVGNGGCLGELWGRAGGLTPPPLAEGDEVRMVVEGIGELVAHVGAAVPAPQLPPARPRARTRRRASGGTLISD
jgi:2-keto-4-pentenoate hydratase/2-oxohepta-3-ene-1,7-dioic acid hydratase in catechol pathway